jgi:aminopeptidase YwaD
MEFLASDAMRGRGSGTEDELLAATYVAAQLRAYGIAPAGNDGSYIQRAVLQKSVLSAPPQLTFAKPGTGDAAEKVTWTYGKEFIAPALSQTRFSGPLLVWTAGADDQKLDDQKIEGAIVLLKDVDRKKLSSTIDSAASDGAVAVITITRADGLERFQERAKRLPTLEPEIEGSVSGLESDLSRLEVSAEAAKTLEALPANTILSLESSFTSETKYTWNAVGMLRGSDPNLRASAVLLSAHLDHLGIGKPVNGDRIYNGADDDASGTSAVLELARILGAGAHPRRTVIFALFGSEETGGQGSTYFREHPPIPLRDIAVNLEFEMLGRADSAVRSDTVWLTGWERSNLGPMLAAHGANLVGDPHPEQNFFARSDNYVLAKKGVVAQTVSSYGLHTDYHQPSDDISHIDFQHMDAAIGSLLRPVSWLVNSSFTPKWNAGGKP